jgi:hypothetical protein
MISFVLVYSEQRTRARAYLLSCNSDAGLQTWGIMVAGPQFVPVIDSRGFLTPAWLDKGIPPIDLWR